jgi:hypothetical protein
LLDASGFLSGKLYPPQERVMDSLSHPSCLDSPLNIPENFMITEFVYIVGGHFYRSSQSDLSIWSRDTPGQRCDQTIFFYLPYSVTSQEGEKYLSQQHTCTSFINCGALMEYNVLRFVQMSDIDDLAGTLLNI